MQRNEETQNYIENPPRISRSLYRKLATFGDRQREESQLLVTSKQPVYKGLLLPRKGRREEKRVRLEDCCEALPCGKECDGEEQCFGVLRWRARRSGIAFCDGEACDGEACEERCKGCDEKMVRRRSVKERQRK
ncbi:hypothetical protein ACOSP7_020835 [Xanthoceras sorbifolium]